jgi:hypothetical protein
MSDDHDFRLNLRRLADEWAPPISYTCQELLVRAAEDYAEENPGDYSVAMPGIILPLFT